MGLSYIGGSERKFQSDNGSAALLRRRTAFLLRGIRVGGAWVVGGTEQLTARGKFWREDRLRNGTTNSERKFLAKGSTGEAEQLTTGGNF